MKENHASVIDKGELLFKVVLFAYLALGSCSLSHGKSFMSYVMYVCFLLGACICLERLLRFKQHLSMPLLICAVGMYISYILSCLTNMEYLTKSSLVYLILWTFYFFVLYTHRKTETRAHVMKEFQLLALLFFIWTTVLVIISIGMLFTGYCYHYKDPNDMNYEVAIGFFSGRLWGAFQDPNLGAVMSCVSIALSAYWFRRCRKLPVRILLVLDVLMLLFYIAVSDSRNGMVSLSVLCAVLTGFACRARFQRKKRRGQIAMMGGLMCLAMVLGLFLPSWVQTGYNNARIAMEARTVAQQVEEQAAENGEAGDTEAIEEQIEAAEQTEPAVVDRGYDMDGDLSNRRLDIWRSGVEIGLSKPVFGVSYVALVPYAEDHMPETYIINNDSWKYNTLDSELVNVFASQGFFGFGVLVLWVLLALKEYVQGAKQTLARYPEEVPILVCIFCVLVVSALFQGTMFYQSNPDTWMFWLCFGSLLFLLRSCRKEAQTNN